MKANEDVESLKDIVVDIERLLKVMEDSKNGVRIPRLELLTPDDLICD